MRNRGWNSYNTYQLARVIDLVCVQTQQKGENYQYLVQYFLCSVVKVRPFLAANVCMPCRNETHGYDIVTATCAHDQGWIFICCATCADEYMSSTVFIILL